MKRRRLYLAYGSNLHLQQMAYRCPDAVVVAKTEIPNYRLTFQGRERGAVATIEPAEGYSVPVLMWEISPSDERSLDFYEGYPTFYDKQDFNVDVDGTPITAMAYVMTPGHVYGSPNMAYLRTIQEGYYASGFDTDILVDALEYSEDRIGMRATGTAQDRLTQQSLF